MGYVGILNFLVLILTFKKVYEIPGSAFLVVFICLLFGLIIGFIDYKYIMGHEWEIGNRNNDIKKDLEEIKKCLKN